MKTNTHFLLFLTQFFFRMRNVSDKSCKENQNIHFCFNNVFTKIRPFMRLCPWYNQRSHRWQYNMAHANCMLAK